MLSSVLVSRESNPPTLPDSGLRLSVDVMNLFDTRTAVIYNTSSTSSRTDINKLWGMPDYNDPRTVTFSASYSF